MRLSSRLIWCCKSAPLSRLYKYEAVRTIFGNDINEESIAIAKIRILLCILRKVGAYAIDGLANITNPNFYSYDYIVSETKGITYDIKGMQTMQKGKIFDEIISIFSDGELNEGAPYNIFHKIVKAVDFGIPQKRERLIIIGTRTISFVISPVTLFFTS